jgi:2-polyprenyl-6-methoxyphenol hydroxylase-like FAD-dependent oxidoreductase
MSAAVCYVDPAGRGRGRLEYADLASVFDGRMFTFMRGDLERVLWDAVGDRASVRFGTTVADARRDGDGVVVGLTDGSSVRVDLLVGADGIHSRVRDLVFGSEPPLLRYLGYHTASYVFADDDLLRRVGDRFLMVAVAGRQVGLYPTNDGRLAAWFVHWSPEEAVPDDRGARLRTTYSDLGELVLRALRHCPDDENLYYDQVAQIELDGWTRRSTVLVGDACQAVSLMAGQGASMAVGGAYVLAEELRRGGPVARAGARYERRLRPLIRDKQAAGRSTARWLVPRHGWELALRRAAFTAMRLPGAAAVMRRGLAAMRASVVTREE